MSTSARGGPAPDADRPRPRDGRLLVGRPGGLGPGVVAIGPGEGGDLAAGDVPRPSRKGHREGVVVSDGGRVRLGQALQPARHARRGTGLGPRPDPTTATLFAATGDEGQGLPPRGRTGRLVGRPSTRRTRRPCRSPSCADGHVFAGTGPSGQVIDVTDPEHPSSRPDRAVQYIWDLAADPKGNLYAATGPTGQLWKRLRTGRGRSCSTAAPHLLCVAVGPDGAVYAGSDGEGLIYRVGRRRQGVGRLRRPADRGPHPALRPRRRASMPGRRPSRAAAPGAARAAARLVLRRRSAANPAPPRRRAPRHRGRAARRGRRPQEARIAPVASRRPTPIPSAGLGLARAVSSGENSVYRIGADGVPREVFRVKAMIFALAWQGDRLLVGTGPEGQLFEVRDLGRESAPSRPPRQRPDPRDAPGRPGAGLILGTGDPGAVVRVDARATSREGTLTSDVLDTKLISRFGALSWRAERPRGDVARRPGPHRERRRARRHLVGLVERADRPARLPRGRPPRPIRPVSAPPWHDPRARRHARAERRCRSATRRRTSRPRSPRSTCPTSPPATARSRQTRLTLRWDVTDPNGDDLDYTLHDPQGRLARLGPARRRPR